MRVSWPFQRSFSVIISGTVLAACISLSSCAFGDKEDVVQALTADDNVIYVAGRYNTHACLWVVQGSSYSRVMLPEPPGSTQSAAMAIIAAQGRIMASGWYSIAGTAYPALWVNGAAVPFPAGGNSMTVINGASLAADRDRICIAAVVNNKAAMILNGITMLLQEPSGTMYSYAYSATFDGPRVVVGGLVNNGPNDRACAWIDGLYSTIDTSGINSAAYGVKVYNGHLYAAGYTNSTNAALWIDGVFYQVSPGDNAGIYGFDMLDGIPCMAGRYVNVNNYATMWIGGRDGKQVLSPTSGNATALGVFACPNGPGGASVMVAGRQDDSGIATAYLWINGAAFKLDGYGITDNTEARAVTVGPKIWQ